MPAATSRSWPELARLTGINIVAPTGLHHDRFYGPAHWSHRIGVEAMADLFTADIELGIDALDYSGPVVRRTDHRAGVIKVAGSDGGPSPRDRRVFDAAAARPSPDRGPDPHPLRGGHRWARAGPGTLVDAGVPASAHRAQPRRQGRRSRLSPRPAGDGRHRRVRRIVPLGRPAERDAPAAGLDGRGRAARSRSCSGWMPRGRATTGCTADRPASAGCSTASRRPWRRSVWTRRSEPACSSTNPARAFAFTTRDEEGEP